MYIHIMKREEFIEKYGEEAYEKILARNRKYHNEHKEKRNQQRKEHYIFNKEKVLKQAAEYREQHREKYRLYSRDYYNKNKEKVLDAAKHYGENGGYKRQYEKHKHHKKEYRKQYKLTKEGKANILLGNYRYSDKYFNRGVCTLTQEWILENVFNSKCIYCGDDNWTHLGADRIDNTLPHTPDNCICSCGVCNTTRRDRYSVEEFIEYRKTHPRIINIKDLQEIVEINGVKVIRKRG